MTLYILGRQPALGFAELESLYGSTHLSAIRPDIALLDIPIEEQLPPKRLGGTVKTARLLTRIESTQFKKLIDYAAKALPDHLIYIPEGKIKLGISLYGIEAKNDAINKAGLHLKKVIKDAGRSVRVVPNTEPALSSAQTLHNQLTSELGLELVFIRDGSATILAQVTWVQNIEDYTRRDRERPKRDARVGMLPPKLAQIMINVGVGTPSRKITILDPFCGTGVILQESLLMGYKAYGTDIEPRMIDYTRANLEWLSHTYDNNFPPYKLEVADATTATWELPIDAVISETYLGKPLFALPPPDKLQGIVAESNAIVREFLISIAHQLPPLTHLCIAVPAWKTNDGFKHLPVVDELEEIGYNQASFVAAETGDLIYHRPDQIVARELLVLTRK